MSEQKKLDFETFEKEYKDIVEFKQITATNYNQLILYKTFLDQAQNLDENIKKELEEKVKTLTQGAQEEVKEADKRVTEYVTNLVKAIFEYHKEVVETPNNFDCKVNTLRKILNVVGGGLNAELIFNLVKVLWIDNGTFCACEK